MRINPAILEDYYCHLLINIMAVKDMKDNGSPEGRDYLFKNQMVIQTIGLKSIM